MYGGSLTVLNTSSSFSLSATGRLLFCRPAIKCISQCVVVRHFPTADRVLHCWQGCQEDCQSFQPHNTVVNVLPLHPPQTRAPALIRRPPGYGDLASRYPHFAGFLPISRKVSFSRLRATNCSRSGSGFPAGQPSSGVALDSNSSRSKLGGISGENLSDTCL